MSDFLYSIVGGKRYIGNNSTTPCNAVHGNIDYSPNNGILVIPANPPIYAISRFAFYRNVNIIR